MKAIPTPFFHGGNIDVLGIPQERFDLVVVKCIIDALFFTTIGDIRFESKIMFEQLQQLLPVIERKRLQKSAQGRRLLLQLQSFESGTRLLAPGDHFPKEDLFPVDMGGRRTAPCAKFRVMGRQVPLKVMVDKRKFEPVPLARIVQGVDPIQGPCCQKILKSVIEPVSVELRFLALPERKCGQAHPAVEMMENVGKIGWIHWCAFGHEAILSGPYLGFGKPPDRCPLMSGRVAAKAFIQGDACCGGKIQGTDVPANRYVEDRIRIGGKNGRRQATGL